MLYEKIEAYLESARLMFGTISIERKEILQAFAKSIKQKINKGEEANLVFICTHNSRRSTFGQIWAKTAASYFNIDKINTFSGGTEATAFNPRAVAAIERAGFDVKKLNETSNPNYQVNFAENADGIVCYSKTFDDNANPKTNFFAVMTCNDADKNCPFIPGALERISLKYVDPKIADGTTQEEKVYDERCFQIATEMCYLFDNAKILI